MTFDAQAFTLDTIKKIGLSGKQFPVIGVWVMHDQLDRPIIVEIVGRTASTDSLSLVNDRGFCNGFYKHTEIAPKTRRSLDAVEATIMFQLACGFVESVVPLCDFQRWHQIPKHDGCSKYTYMSVFTLCEDGGILYAVFHNIDFSPGKAL